MRHTGSAISVLDYSEHAIATGTNAEAVAYVQLSINGRRVSGAGISHDTISASLRAVLSAFNRSDSAHSRAPLAA
jgi:2-isopropylmalate synthase